MKEIISIVKDVEKREVLYILVGNVNWQPLWKALWRIQKVKNRIAI